MTKTTFQTNSNSTSYSARDFELSPVNPPAVALRCRSSHTSSLGVYVEGSMTLRQGQSTPLSLSLDPVALERKLAVKQVEMELQGSPSAQTINRPR